MHWIYYVKNKYISKPNAIHTFYEEEYLHKHSINLRRDNMSICYALLSLPDIYWMSLCNESIM